MKPKLPISTMPAGIIAAAGAIVLLLTAPVALAQQPQPSSSDRPAGVTSGPAAGTPATLGTGGEVPASPHQTGVLDKSGGATVQHEQQGQSGGAAPVRPGQTGSESGRSPDPNTSDGTKRQ
jgi:hypothetical protein